MAKSRTQDLGCDMLQDCTVPFGSGLSSSAAIEISTIAAPATIAGEPLDRVQIALKAQQAEREYAGVNCGIMDQYASACGKKDKAILLDCNTLECEYLPLELGEYSLVITNCNKPHNLIESKYNERRAETEQALKLLQKDLNVNCLAEVTPEQFKKYGRTLPTIIRRRANHVVGECERVRLAVTDFKGLQLYVGKTAAYNGRGGGCGFCLEPQFFPNAVNIEGFETPYLPVNTEKIYSIRYLFGF